MMSKYFYVPEKNEFYCSECGDSFPTVGGAQSHNCSKLLTTLRPPKAEKPKKVLPRRKEVLKNQQSGPKPKKYPCPVCKRVFGYKKHLIKHFSDVHGELPCRLCGIRYRGLEYFCQYHLRYAHKTTAEEYFEISKDPLSD